MNEQITQQDAVALFGFWGAVLIVSLLVALAIATFFACRPEITAMIIGYMRGRKARLK